MDREIATTERLFRRHETGRTSPTAEQCQSWQIDMPIVVGEPTSGWWLIGTVAGGALLALIVARAAMIKLRRRRPAVLRPA